MTERYDPDAEIIARAMADIRETVEAANRPPPRASQRRPSEQPGAIQRRALLRILADAHHGDLMGVQQQPQAAEPQLEEERI